MRKTSAILLAFILCIFSSACGKNDIQEPPQNNYVITYDGSVSAGAGSRTLSNDNVAVSVSDAGVITSIVSGADTIMTTNSAALQASVEYSSAASMWDAYSFNTRIASAASVKSDGTSITISYTAWTQAISGFTLDLRIRLAGDCIYFDNTINNGSSGTVTSVTAPLLTGFHEISGGALRFPNRNGAMQPNALKPDSAGGNRVARVMQMLYPVPMSAQYYIYGTDNLSVSLRCLDSKMAEKYFNFGGTSNEMSIQQYTFAQKGKTVMPSNVIEVTHNDWHTPCLEYQQWFYSWGKSPLMPNKIADMPSIDFTTIEWNSIVPSQADSVDMMLNKIGATKNRGYSGTELSTWWGGPSNPTVGNAPQTWQDERYPDYTYPQSIGDKAGLADFVDQAHAMGMQIGFYTNSRLLSMEGDGAPTPIPGYSAMTQYGQAKIDEWQVDNHSLMGERNESYWFNNYVVACPGSGMFDVLADRLTEFVEAGMDFLQLDQIGAALSFLCFNKSHGHSTPQTAWAEGYTKYLTRMAQLSAEDKYGVWYWIEGSWEGAGQYTQISQNGMWDEMGFKAGSTVHMPELYQFTFNTFKLYGGAWIGGVPIWWGYPTDVDQKIVKENAAFYRYSSYMDNYGLTYDSSGIKAVWHKSKDNSQVMMLAQSLGNGIYTVALDKSLVGGKSVSDFTVQQSGTFKNITVSETGTQIIMTLNNFTGGNFGGVMISLN